MDASLDMTVWQGRVDAAEGDLALRWHQKVRAYAPGVSAGVALLGFASDEGVRRNQGRIGARQGPQVLRQMLANLAWHGGHLPLYDMGDVACSDADLSHAQAMYSACMTELLDAGHFPMGLGGGHEIAFASFGGLAGHFRKRDEKPRIGIINFDAHFDLRAADQASSGTPFLQISEACRHWGWPFQYCCLGISRPSNTLALFAQADRLGVRYVHDYDMRFDRLASIETSLAAFMGEVDHIYMTVCLDVMPASQAPGVSAPAAHGVELPLVEHLVRTIKKSGKVRMADIAELNPRFDIDHRTARCTARIATAML